MRQAVVTIAASNYAGRVDTLMGSVEKWEPLAQRFVVWVDPPVFQMREIAESIDPTMLPIGPARLELMATFYDVTEYATALKPFALEYLLDRGFDAVVYLDPDTVLFAPLDEVRAGLDVAPVVLTPHVLAAIPSDGLRPSDDDIRAAGTYNLGFFACGPAAREVLRAWGEHVVLGAVNLPSENLFTDQRWVDVMPALLPCHILRHRGYNVAYWNLHERPLAMDSGVPHAGGEPLVLFHFSGFDPSEPWRLSRHVSARARVTTASSTVLGRMCESYAREVIRRSSANAAVSLAPSTAFPGRLIPALPRWLERAAWSRLRAELSSGWFELPDRGSVSDQPVLGVWLRTPPPDESTGGLSRLAILVWRERADLQAAFCEPSTTDRAAFQHWLTHQGSREIGISPSDWTVAVDLVPVEGSGWQCQGEELHPAINMVGYFTSPSGVGEAARILAAAVEREGWRVHRVNSMRTKARSMSAAPLDRPVGGLPTIWCVNADQLYDVMSDFSGLAESSPCNVGVWYWETTTCPEYFRHRADLVDEIWAPTRFIREAVESRVGSRVRLMPMVLRFDIPAGLASAGPDAPGRLPIFLTRFDYFSDSDRKNPEGVIEAYCRAFPVPGRAQLVVKSANGHHFPDRLERLAWRVRNRSDITVVDGHLSVEDNWSLTASCDVFVSLHRSEGLGLNIAEAMLLGKPAIVTGFSGNLDFCSEETALLVGGQLVPIPVSASSPYFDSGVWMEPDIDEAAALMSGVVHDMTKALKVAERGREHIQSLGDTATLGAFMMERLTAAIANRELMNGDRGVAGPSPRVGTDGARERSPLGRALGRVRVGYGRTRSRRDDHVRD